MSERFGAFTDRMFCLFRGAPARFPRKPHQLATEAGKILLRLEGSGARAAFRFNAIGRRQFAAAWFGFGG
jgi:hypothetical protein